MIRGRLPRLRYLATLWAAGTLALALVVAVCFQLGLNLDTTAFLLLCVITGLSLYDSLISSVTFSIAATASLTFFFAPPIYSFYVDDVEDLLRLAAFFLSSIVVTTLVRKVRAGEEMQGRQARLLDLTHDAVLVCDMSDVILFWNRGAEELYGWSRKEAVGKIPYELLRTEFPVPRSDIIEELLRTGQWNGELIQHARSGSKVHAASRWSLQRDETGEPIGFLVSDRDISKRKLAEEALRRSQAAYLAEAQRLSLTGSFGWNVASGELLWSEETFRIFGVELDTKPSVDLVLERVHPDDRLRVREAIQWATSNREAFDFEHRLLMLDGAVKTLHVVARPQKGASSEFQFVGAVMDVTARTLAYAALEESERRHRLLFQHIPVALLQIAVLGDDIRERFAAEPDLEAFLDANPEYVQRTLASLRILAANQRAVEMLGAHDASQLLSATLLDLWMIRQDTFKRNLLSRMRGEPTFEEETQIPTFDGRAIDVVFRVTRFYEIHTGYPFVLYTFSDVTERNRVQATLRRLQAEFAHAARISVLGELTASIAHEVNQPLAAICANGEAGVRWLDRSEPDVAEATAIMKRIVADAQRAGAIIARTRDMAAGQTPQQAALSLDAVIEEALLFLRHELQAQGVSVSLDRTPGLPPVIGDRTQLHQVIVNLAVNAAQAMTQANATRRTLLIRTAPTGADKLTCTIEDSGPGIAPEHLDRLFDSYFTTKTAGMGMGLAISRSIIEQHGGQLRAENGSSLGGARFSFTLPTTPS